MIVRRVKLAVLSPHLDDSVLSCWHLLENRHPVTVVNVFAGSPPPGGEPPWWDRLTGAHDSAERMRERREEDERALAHVGRSAVNLDFLDDQYGRTEPPEAQLLDQIPGLLEPGTVIHAPAGLGRHPDHEVVRDVALRLARAGWPLVLYADLPHAISDGWPAWVSGTPAAGGPDVGAEWHETLADAGLHPERLLPRVRPLGAATRARKLAALDEYRTQRPWLDLLCFAPLEDPRALAFEVTWEVPPSALRSVAEPGREPLVADAGGDPLYDLG